MSDVLAPVRLIPAHTVVADRLRRSIALGEVLPGERLPSERSLAEGLRVSRLTVRAALRVLQDEGAIVTRRGATGGAFVTARTAPIDEDRVREVFEYRLAVETGAARLAAARRSESDLARLAEQDRAIRRAADAG